MRDRITFLGLTLLLTACGPGTPESGQDETWRGTTSTEGETTTVYNESGSVWGGDRVLVQEASIGIAEGADEEMFGMVTSVFATDRHIYVLDSQIPVVRVFDHSGEYLRDLGRAGEGPGEYTRPALVAAREDGTTFVFAARLGRINVYSPSGEPAGSWPLQESRCCVWPIYPLGDNSVWAPVQGWPDSAGQERSVEERRVGAQAVGPDGRAGQILWVPQIEYRSATHVVREGWETETPFSAWLNWSPTPAGGLVFGASDRYRFEVRHPDGSTTVVTRAWEPVPVPAEHREWERRRTIASYRSGIEDWTWDGAEMPTYKPAYASLIPASSGATWVVRFGASERRANCAEDPIEAGFREASANPCWVDDLIADVFGPDGRFLGSVPLPDDLWLPATPLVHVADRRVVAVVQDSEGTVRVKRYRLELPQEESGAD